MTDVIFQRLPNKEETILFSHAIVGITELRNMQAIGVIVLGGGTVPVEGTKDEILKKIRAAAATNAASNQGEKKNGISKRKR